MPRPQVYNLLGECPSVLSAGLLDGRNYPEIEMFRGPNACALGAGHAAVWPRSGMRGNPWMTRTAELVLIVEPVRG